MIPTMQRTERDSSSRLLGGPAAVWMVAPPMSLVRRRPHGDIPETTPRCWVALSLGDPGIRSLIDRGVTIIGPVDIAEDVNRALQPH